MKTDKQIKAEAAQAGQIGVEKLQLEVLLDIREHLKTLTERWKKPGRPRKKKAADKPKPVPY